MEILRRRVPEANLELIRSATDFVGHVRTLDVDKAPGIAEAINWVAALSVLGSPSWCATTWSRRSARWPRPPTTATWSARPPAPTRSADRWDALQGVDRAAFVVALGERLRPSGVPVTSRR